MKLILKLFAVPLALGLSIVVMLCSIILAASGFAIGLASSGALLVSVVLLVTGQTTGGLVILVAALVLGGLPAVGELFVKKLGGGAGALRAFIFS